MLMNHAGLWFLTPQEKKNNVVELTEASVCMDLSDVSKQAMEVSGKIVNSVCYT